MSTVAGAASAQLSLPIDEPTADLTAPTPRAKRIFVNRDLPMTGVDWVGFDMDYTLAIYRQEAMDKLSIDATLSKLIKRGYPAWVQDAPVPLDFAIRGLLIDRKLGHVLKMDRFKIAQKGYHGLEPLSRDTLTELYHQRRVRITPARFHWVDTLYALSEATVYAALIDAFEKRNVPVQFDQLFSDIRECIDEAHRDGTILDAVLGDLPKFVYRDPALATTLHKLRSAGKKLFLLTNSRRAYTEKMMEYLLGGAMSEYPAFQHYFDVVIVAASKPAFFQERRPLMMHTAAGTLEQAVAPLERGKIYEAGNLFELEAAINVTGDRILYVGDHIYGDILRSKRDSAWRTTMIIQELEVEVAAHEACIQDLERLTAIDEKRAELEDQLRTFQARYKDTAKKLDDAATGTVHREQLEVDRNRVKRTVERIRGLLKALEAEGQEIQARTDKLFHPYWGSLLKERNEVSSFGDQVEEYACLYTSRVSNFMTYSPQQNFRSPRELMPHELW